MLLNGILKLKGNISLIFIRRYCSFIVYFFFRLFDRGETETGISQVRQLLNSEGDDLEQSVRRGDVFATVAQHYVNIGDNEKARATVVELKRIIPGINLTHYFNVNLLETLGYNVDVQRQDISDKEDDIEELLGD